MKILHTFFSLMLSDAGVFDLHRTSPPSSSSSSSKIRNWIKWIWFENMTWRKYNRNKNNCNSRIMSDCSCNYLYTHVSYLSFTSLSRLCPCWVFLRISFTSLFTVLFSAYFFQSENRNRNKWKSWKYSSKNYVNRPIMLSFIYIQIWMKTLFHTYLLSTRSFLFSLSFSAAIFSILHFPSICKQ